MSKLNMDQLEVKLPPHITNPDPAIYLSPNYGVLDFETTNLDKGSALNPSNRTVLSVVQWGTDTDTTPVPTIHTTWGNELEQDAILSTIERADFIVAHNAKFELQWLERIGASLENLVVWDTQIAEYVLYANSCGGKGFLTLEQCCQRRGLGGKSSVVSEMIHAGVCPSEIPNEWLEEYCIQDVYLTGELFKQQLVEAQERGLLGVIYTRCLAAVVLADIEKNGMALDPEAVRMKYAEVLNEVNKYQIVLNSFGDNVNWGSPDQVATMLYDDLGFDVPLNYKREPMLTPGGKRSVGKDTLAALRAKTDKQRQFVAAYKEWNKYNDMLSKYLSKMVDCCNDDNGILYANFNLTVAKTLRLTSSGKKYKIQFHNFDRTLKPLFKARHEGWLIEEDDGASLEFRVAGHLGRDLAIIDAIRNQFDVHRFTASVLNRCEEDVVTGDQRTLAKKDTFKPLYGGRSGTEAQKAYYAAFRERYPGITGTQDSWIDKVLKEKQLVTETGLIFYWPSTKMTRTGYITNRESICNYPVQYLATGEIIPIALIYQWHKLKALKMQSFIVNTIHDSIVSEIHPDEAEVYRQHAINSFTHDVYRYLNLVYTIDFTCPLGIGSKLGDHWGKGEEIKINIVENKYGS